MKIQMLKAKLHRATVTDANVEYEGSISIDRALCEAARLLPYEKVDVYDCNNGARLSTYVIYGKPGEICLNGAAARLVQPGDLVIICSYCEVTEEEALQHKPKVLLLGPGNEIKTVSV
jgi:aspartate 1-decarboxylase